MQQRQGQVNSGQAWQVLENLPHDAAAGKVNRVVGCVHSCNCPALLSSGKQGWAKGHEQTQRTLKLVIGGNPLRNVGDEQIQVLDSEKQTSLGKSGLAEDEGMLLWKELYPELQHPP